MKYVFTFKEINYGSVEIEADTKPNDGDVTAEIMNGKAYFSNTDYEDIVLIESGA